MRIGSVPLLCVLAITLCGLAAPAPADEQPPAASAPAPPQQSSPSLGTTLGVTYLAGVGAAAVTVPTMLYLGGALGKLSPDLAASLVPPVLLFLLIPPLAVAGMEWQVGRRLDPGLRFHPAVWAGLGINALALVLGAVGGVWIGDPLSFSLFTVADALIMPAGVTLLMYYTRRRAKHPPAAHAGLAHQPAPVVLLPTQERQGWTQPALLLPLARFSF